MLTRQIHSVDLLEMALEAAARLGYRIREDALDGFPGGACELKGQKWLFLDPSLATQERLHLVLDALAADERAATIEMPQPLAGVLNKHRI
jgi:hypothetical protein